MDNSESSRLYHRFPINNNRLCFISQNGAVLGHVSELSYGGFSVKADPVQTQLLKKLCKNLKTENGLTVEFNFLNHFITCQIEHRYSNQDRIGFQLVHEQTQVLTFLKEIIPWIRFGAALSQLEKMEREGLEGELPEYLSFDGPIPVEIEWHGVDSQKTPNFALNFNQDKVQYQLKRKNGHIETSHNVWPGAESGELRPTKDLDSMILKSAIAVLVGLATNSQSDVFNKMIEVVLTLFEKSQPLMDYPAQKKTG
jgi:hypothetical protein